jgi:hypothetical protein
MVPNALQIDFEEKEIEFMLFVLLMRSLCEEEEGDTDARD